MDHEYRDPMAGDWTGFHWAVEIPDGDRNTRLMRYQTRERPARIAAERGGFRLLCRQVTTSADGFEWYGPWRDVTLATPTKPAPPRPKEECGEINPHKDGYACRRPRGHEPADNHIFWPMDRPALDDRLYFVYREDSALPLLAGWRDEQAALQYAKDSNASVVLGVDVIYRAIPPFESGVIRRTRGGT